MGATSPRAIRRFDPGAQIIEYVCPWCGTGRTIRAADVITNAAPGHPSGKPCCVMPACPGCGTWHSFPITLRPEHEDPAHVATGYDPHYADEARHIRALCMHLGVHRQSPLWMHLPAHLAHPERLRWNAAHAAAGTHPAVVGTPGGHVPDPPHYVQMPSPPDPDAPPPAESAPDAPRRRRARDAR